MRRRSDGRHGDATTFQSSSRRADIFLTCTHLGRIHQNRVGKAGGEPDSRYWDYNGSSGMGVLGTTDDGASWTKTMITNVKCLPESKVGIKMLIRRLSFADAPFLASTDGDNRRASRCGESTISRFNQGRRAQE